MNTKLIEELYSIIERCEQHPNSSLIIELCTFINSNFKRKNKSFNK